MVQSQNGMIIELTELETVRAYLARIESVPLKDITWMRNGKTILVNPEAVEEWKFTGMNNRDFALFNLTEQ